MALGVPVGRVSIALLTANLVSRFLPCTFMTFSTRTRALLCHLYVRCFFMHGLVEMYNGRTSRCVFVCFFFLQRQLRGNEKDDAEDGGGDVDDDDDDETEAEVVLGAVDAPPVDIDHHVLHHLRRASNIVLRVDRDPRHDAAAAERSVDLTLQLYQQSANLVRNVVRGAAAAPHAPSTGRVGTTDGKARIRALFRGDAVAAKSRYDALQQGSVAATVHLEDLLCWGPNTIALIHLFLLNPGDKV